MPFPTSPVSGTTYTAPNGITYEYTARGLWKALSVPSDARIRFTASETPPDVASLGDQWFDLTTDMLKSWVFDGVNYEWMPISGEGLEFVGDAVPSDLALPLSWLYSSEGFAFEFWRTDPRYSWRDFDTVAVLQAIEGDDTLDVTSTDQMSVNNRYAVYLTDGRRTEIDVAAILTNSRIRTRLDMPFSITADDGARLGVSSFTIDGGVALAEPGDVLFSKSLDTLRNRSNGRMTIRRSAVGGGEFTVEYRPVGSISYATARLIDSVARDRVYRDETYEIQGGGTLEFRISYSSSDAEARETVYHMVLYAAPENIELGRVEKPNNVSPADQAVGLSATPTLVGSTYRSLYNIPQGGAEFQIAEDNQFSNLVINTSSDFLASWINTTPFAGTVNDLQFYDFDSALAVGDAGLIRRTDDRGATWTTLTSPASVAWYAVHCTPTMTYLCGAGGNVWYSADRGNTWTQANIANSYSGTFRGIAAQGSNVLVVGELGEIQRSVNGGVIFNKVAPDGGGTPTFYDVTMNALGRSVVVGNNNVQTFAGFEAAPIKRTVSGNPVLRTVDFDDNGYGIAAGDAGAIRISSDFGSSWRTVGSETGGDFRSVSVNKDYAVLVGGSGVIESSADQGETWHSRPAAGGFSGAFNAVDLIDGFALISGVAVLQNTLNIEGIATNTYTVPPGTDKLTTNKVYWWRARYKDTVGFWSEFSEPTAFATMATFNFVLQPSNLSPAEGASGIGTSPTLQASAFQFQGAPDIHETSIWQVATNAGFANPVYNSGEIADLSTHKLPANVILNDRTTYFWRVRYKGQLGNLSSWSVPTKFETRSRPNKPSLLTPANGSEGVSLQPVLTSSPYSSSSPGVALEYMEYQLSLTATFASVAHEVLANYTPVSFSAVNQRLNAATRYYARVRHRGQGTDWSEWSNTVSFTTNPVAVAKPVVTAAVNSPVSATLAANAFGLVGSGGTAEHVSTDWEIRSAANEAGTLVWTSNNQTVNKNQITVSGLPTNTLLYARARFTGSAYGNSPWSDFFTFRTTAVTVQTPQITVASVTTGSNRATLQSSAFALSSASVTDAHELTDWEIRTAPDGGGTVAWSAYNSTANKVSYSNIELAPGTYYPRVRHKAATYGFSNWSTNSMPLTVINPVGEQIYTTPGQYTFVVPANVTKVHAVAVGAGAGGSDQAGNGAGAHGYGGGGGGLAWKNNIDVTPGQRITVIVGRGGLKAAIQNSSSIAGGSSSFGSIITATGGSHGGGGPRGVGGTGIGGDGGGTGGGSYGMPGGGAAGYSGNGGNGGSFLGGDYNGQNGQGGGGGGGGDGYFNRSPGGGGGGGGVGLYGQGASGAGGIQARSTAGETGNSGGGGGGGSGGSAGIGGSSRVPRNGGNFGGGGAGGSGSGAAYKGNGGNGAVRIIWGENRSFPFDAA